MKLKNSSLLVRPLLYSSSAIALEMLWYCSNVDNNVAIMLGCCHGMLAVLLYHSSCCCAIAPAVMLVCYFLWT